MSRVTVTAERALVLASAFLVCASPPVGAQQTEDPGRVRFRPIRIEGFSTVVSLQKTHGAEGFDAILRINRLDLPHVRQGATLVVPDPPTRAASLSPFPAALASTDPAQRIFFVSRRVQAVAAYESGVLVRWGPVSTGRSDTPTPAGLFATNWKSKLRRSSDNEEWLLPWYVNFINNTGVSFHQFALPGYPASHACVRLLEADARWIYDWAETWVLADEGRRVAVYGTPVVVFGDYDYEGPPPWTRLADDPRATDVSLDEIDKALAPHRARLAEWAALRSAQR